MIKKILIANRGEIAVRIMKTARQLGIMSVAVFSQSDADSLHVESADEKYSLGNSDNLGETYLNKSLLIEIAVNAGCDAVHPGYGFLSENAGFAKQCTDAGLIFIGPGSEAIEMMGNKIAARNFAVSCGVPVVPGYTGKADEILAKIDKAQFPYLVKAAGGGGGKGMRIVHDPAELNDALEATSREALSYFGDGTVFVEKYISDPRHIEVQILADAFGNTVHLFERECSIQRRYQKIIEEAPSPTLTPEVRAKMTSSAVALAKGIGYKSAGTIEFLVDADLNFYFLEMNTRIQVEHPVTEMTTGIDIVEQQIKIASGEKLSILQDDIKQTGHAIESRIYAEDPEHGFLPSPGDIEFYHQPAGKDIRIDASLDKASAIHSFFDPMIAKLIGYSSDRNSARLKSLEALSNYAIHGIRTNIAYLQAVLNSEYFMGNRISTHFCEEKQNELLNAIKIHNEKNSETAVLAVLIYSLRQRDNQSRNLWNHIGYWRMINEISFLNESERIHLKLTGQTEDSICVQFSEKRTEVKFTIEGNKLSLFQKGDEINCFVSRDETGAFSVTLNGNTIKLTREDFLPRQHDFSTQEGHDAAGSDLILSPMPGKILKINVAEGQTINKGDLLFVLEAMKMENNTMSPVAGKVEKVFCNAGDMVSGGVSVIKLEPLSSIQ